MGGLSDLSLCMFDRQLSRVLMSSLGVDYFEFDRANLQLLVVSSVVMRSVKSCVDS